MIIENIDERIGVRNSELQAIQEQRLNVREEAVGDPSCEAPFRDNTVSTVFPES